MTEHPELLGKAAFARLVLKRSPSYVTALLQAGRLVMVGEGKHAQVRVAESLARIAATRGARDDVEARHAENAGSVIPEGLPGPENAPAASVSALVDIREERARAELRISKAKADQEEMAAAKSRGDLIAREDVDGAMKSVGATVRSLSEVRADQLAALVAPITNLDEVHAIIQDHARDELEFLGQAIAAQKDQLARGAKA